MFESTQKTKQPTRDLVWEEVINKIKFSIGILLLATVSPPFVSQECALERQASWFGPRGFPSPDFPHRVFLIR